MKENICNIILIKLSKQGRCLFMKIAIITDKPRTKYLPTEEGLMEDKQKKEKLLKISKKFFQRDLIVFR